MTSKAFPIIFYNCFCFCFNHGDHIHNIAACLPLQFVSTLFSTVFAVKKSHYALLSLDVCRDRLLIQEDISDLQVNLPDQRKQFASSIDSFSKTRSKVLRPHASSADETKKPQTNLKRKRRLYIKHMHYSSYSCTIRKRSNIKQHQSIRLHVQIASFKI
jgi:hypothetical protein